MDCVLAAEFAVFIFICHTITCPYELFCLFVDRVLAAELAVLLRLESFRMFFLILLRVVVALLAFCAR